MILLYLRIYISALIGAGFVSLLAFRFLKPKCISLLSKLLTIGATFYGMGIIWTSLVSYYNFSEYIDLSYYHSFLQQLSVGRIPLIWDTGVPVWSQHFSPFLFIFVPFYFLGAHADILVFFQAFCAVVAAIPLYLLSKKLTKSIFVSICVVWAYLLSGAIQSSLYYGFHEVTFFPLLFFTVLLMWSKKKYWLFVLSFMLMLFIKEEIAFVGICIGLFLLIQRQWKYGLTALMCGVMWGVVAFGVISRFHHGGYEYWGQFVGGTTTNGILGIISAVFLHPVDTVFSLWFDERKSIMLLESFGSFGFLPIVFPFGFVLLIPSLAMKLLSNNDVTILNSYHYSAVYIGVLTATVVFSIQKCIHEKHYVLIGVFLFCMSCVGSYFYGYGYYYGLFSKMTLGNIRSTRFSVTSHAQAMSSIIHSIPSGASVGCQYQLCSHIERPYGQLYPIPGSTFPEYIIIDTSLSVPLKTEDEINAYFSSSEFNLYTRVAEFESIHLFRK